MPKNYFEMHPLNKIQLPPHKVDDFDDIPPIGLRMAEKNGRIIRESGKWMEAVQACLASDSFADACVGHVLDALEQSAHRDNTIIVLWGDHVYDVGEKKFAKSALWKQTTRTPLIIHVPEKLSGTVAPAKAMRCKRPVSLVDLYPTMIDLCGLPPNELIEGRSLAPLVRNPNREWPYPVIINHSPGWHGNNHAIRSERYHYIHYDDGGEELYDAACCAPWDHLLDRLSRISKSCWSASPRLNSPGMFAPRSKRSRGTGTHRRRVIPLPLQLVAEKSEGDSGDAMTGGAEHGIC